jgi:uncharacterized protein YecA (UPF0149 family)
MRTFMGLEKISIPGTRGVQALRAGRKQRKLPSNIATVVRGGEKVGRNDSCPCGSGKKFKKCCMTGEN